MKWPLFLSLLLTLTIPRVNAQTSLRPSCYSNAIGWTIDKIEQNDDGTYVYMSYYSYAANYRFYIQPGTYIESYNNPGGPKYYIQSFLNNELNQWYNLQPNTEYNFVLKFQRIPTDWTDINIKEPTPAESNVKAWHWDYIALNRPSTDRLKIDNFLVNQGIGFLKQTVHPLTNLKYYRYSVDYNSIRIALYYEGGYVTDLNLGIDFISSVNIVYDNDFVPPFTALEIMRDLIMQQDKDQQSTSRLENYLRKRVNEMNGKELASVALTAMWSNYK